MSRITAEEHVTKGLIDIALKAKELRDGLKRFYAKRVFVAELAAGSVIYMVDAAGRYARVEKLTVTIGNTEALSSSKFFAAKTDGRSHSNLYSYMDHNINIENQYNSHLCFWNEEDAKEFVEFCGKYSLGSDKVV